MSKDPYIRAAGQADAGPPGAAEQRRQTWAQPSPNSQLYALWQEWQSAGEGLDSLWEPLPTQVDPMLTAAEMDTEMRRVSLRLMACASERQRLSRQRKGEALELEAKVFVHVAVNHMVAWMMVLPPLNGGGSVRLEQLREALLEASVAAGTDEALLRRIVEEGLYFRLLPVARGTPPAEGRDGYVEEYYPREHPPLKTEGEPTITEYLDNKYIHTIRQGDPICRAVPPLPGTTGLDVLGTSLQTRSGTPAAPKVGRNTTLLEDGSLVADVDGHILYEWDCFHVQPLRVIEGEFNEHLEFDGDVLLRGDALDRAVIEASGTVAIDGLVEASVITAGGDVVIAAGVLGDNRALIRAKGSVIAKYLENCVVYAGGMVEVDCIIGSHVNSDQRISALNGRGTVIGGRLTAAHRVEAKIIGSKAERLTEVVLGLYPCQAEDAKEIGHQISELRAEYAQVDRRMAELEEEESTPEQLMQLAKCRLRRSAIAIKEERLHKQREALRGECEDYSRCTLHAETLYPVTRVTMGPTTYSIKDRCTPCTVRIDEDWTILLNGRGVR